MKTIGIFQLSQMKFKLLEFEGEWLSSFGKPEYNFKAIVYGNSGNGKTDFCVKLAKKLTKFDRVLYVSQEEGISQTVQEAFERNKMEQVAGKVILAAQTNFEELLKYLAKKNSPRYVILDSIDYMRLTAEQYKELIAQFPKKSFIIISWSKGKHPKSQAAKDIEYMADIKVLVEKYIAKPRSRFGGNNNFIIWPEKVASMQAALDAAKQTNS